MDKSLFLLLDKFLIFFHTFFILFNLFGWIWIRTRKLNLISLLTVAFCWLILGFWYGVGYCPLTDLHWHVKSIIGENDVPYSYIKYLVDYYFNTDSNPVVIDYLTAISLVGALMISIYLNFKKKTFSEFFKYSVKSQKNV